MGAIRPSFEYLSVCSTESLESFELSRLNRAANLRTQLRDIVEQWIDAEVEARMARWLLEERRADVPNHIRPPVALDGPRPHEQLLLALPLLAHSAEPKLLVRVNLQASLSEVADSLAEPPVTAATGKDMAAPLRLRARAECDSLAISPRRLPVRGRAIQPDSLPLRPSRCGSLLVSHAGYRTAALHLPHCRSTARSTSTRCVA